MKKYICLVIFLLSSIGVFSQSATASLEHLTAIPGQEVDVAVVVTGFAHDDKLGAVSMYIAYDPGVLEYIGIKEAASPDFTVNVFDEGNGLNEVGTTLTSVNGINIDDGNNLIVLTFLYKGGSTGLSFTVECDFTLPDPEIIFNMSYTNGSVSPLNPENMVQVIIGSEQALLNNEVPVPVTVRNFENIGAFTFTIAFNTGSLEFVDLDNLHADIDPAELTFNNTGGNVFIVYSMLAGALEGLTMANDGKLFDLVFLYKGGSSPLTFIQLECEVSEFNDLTPIPLLYTDGEVTASEVFEATVTIADVLSLPGLPVDVPVTATGLDLLGAFTFAIGYNPTNLTITDINSVIQNIHPLLSANGTLVSSLEGSTIFIAWNLSGEPDNGLEIPDNDKLFDIRFTALSGVTPLIFNLLESEISKLKNVNEVSNYNVLYVDGSVTVTESLLTIKVMLEGFYNGTSQMNKAKDFVGNVIVNKFAGTVVDVIHIELHDAGSYGTIVFAADNVALNLDGTASVGVPEALTGSYYVTVKHRNHLETVSASPVSFAGTLATHDFTAAASQAYGDNQKQLTTGVYGIYAGDVNQDGIIDGQDRSLVQSKIIKIAEGYLIEDINGDGQVIGFDRSIVQGNLIRIIKKKTP